MFVVLWQRTGRLYGLPAAAGILPGFELAGVSALTEAHAVAFLGRFGPEPPVRSTIADAGGIPGSSLVEHRLHRHAVAAPDWARGRF